MKTRYVLKRFYLNGLKQDPVDRDFNITPSLVFAKADEKEIGDLGWVVAIGIKWGFAAIGISLYAAYIKQ